MPEPAAHPESPRAASAWAAAGWTLLALFATAQHISVITYSGGKFRLPYITAFHLIDWWGVGIFTPLFLWIVRRWPVTRTSWRRNGAIQVFITALLVPVKFSLCLPFFKLLWPQAGFSLVRMLAEGFFPQLASFWAILVVFHALAYSRALRERPVRESRLEAQLSEARLQALKMQLQPHFLFNTLHAISTLMHRDVEGASTMIAELADLLRAILAGESSDPAARRRRWCS